MLAPPPCVTITPHRPFPLGMGAVSQAESPSSQSEITFSVSNSEDTFPPKERAKTKEEASGEE